MIIGVPTEIKKNEYRVAMTPMGVELLIKEGHEIYIEKGAGVGSGFDDIDYAKAGAKIVGKKTLFNKSQLIVKVKEPLEEEYDFFEEKQAIFTYLHLASNLKLINFLCKKKITALAYETLEVNKNLPLLAPMSEIAGKMAPLVGSYFLQKIHSGSGILPFGVVGVKPAKVVILGAGNVGFNSARVSYGMGMETVVLNRGMDKLQKIDEIYSGRIKTKVLNNFNVLEEIVDAHIVIGAILVPGGKTPIVINKEMLKKMKRGSVIVDVSVDQGGCVETTRPTTHDNPVYVVDGIIHYAVANMPGAYPRTSTMALTNATLNYILEIANKGIKMAIQDPIISTALNIYNGKVVHKELKKIVAKV